MLVVLGQEAEGDGGYSTVAPGLVQTAEEHAATLQSEETGNKTGLKESSGSGRRKMGK